MTGRWGRAAFVAGAIALAAGVVPSGASAEEGAASGGGAIAYRGEVYGSLGYAALAGDIYGSNGALGYGLGVNNWFAGASPNWVNFFGIDLAWLGSRDARTGTQFPFQAGKDLQILRSTLSLNVCRVIGAESRLCVGVGYALLSLTQSSNEQTYGVPVYILTFKHPIAERWLLGVSTDWSVASAKVGGTSFAQEFWRSKATVGFLF